MGFNSKISSIPTITNAAQMEAMLAVWRHSLGRTLKQASPPPPPLNFTATSVRGGIQLNWGLTNPISKNNVLGAGTSPTGPDGYQILISQNGSFVDDVQVVQLSDLTQTQYFHPVGGSPTAFSFKIQSTSGTQASPQSRSGPPTGAIRHVSIDATDTTTKPTIVRDLVTGDAVRATARLGSYTNPNLRTYGGANLK